MLLKELSVDELREVASEFAVDVDGITNKKGLLDSLAAEGVTQNMYEESVARKEAAAAEEPVVEEIVIEQPLAPKKGAKEYLIKMDRHNSLYETYGKSFTREHPFAVCDDVTARKILENEEGFRLANPGEAEKFYG